jgi:hypothetical protein
MHVCTRALLGSEAGSGADGCMAASEPSRIVRWVWSLRTRDSVRALLGGRVESRALGHVATPEPSLSREVGSRAAVACGSAWAHASPFVLA